MVKKTLLQPQRVRRVPARFSWIDHRFVRDGHIRQCSPEALALYLLLICVGDAEGLSYYADPTIAGLISVDEGALRGLRNELKAVGLIAYKRPLYQVLDLACPQQVQRTGRCLSVAEILKGGAHD